MIHDEYVKYEKRMEEKELKRQQEEAEENSNKIERKVIKRETKTDENERNMLLSAKILERMITQNNYSEIAFDFKYWEDRSDDYKEFEGTLYPLWNFSFDETKQQVDKYLLEIHYFQMCSGCYLPVLESMLQ